MINKILKSADYIREKIAIAPKYGLVLGSGLGDFADNIDNPVVIPYGDIPNFPISTAPGHKSQLVIGELEGKPVVCMQGRFHYYEGYTMQEVTYPIRVMKELGVEKVILTNACGGLNPEFTPGDLMVIEDHINSMGDNPLIGPNMEEYGPRFLDMSQPYDQELIKLAHEAAKERGIDLKQGVYISYSGPSFETAAEIRKFRSDGGSAVGMSTVPEVIVARHCGMSVLAISCITNLGTGILDQPLSGEEVIEVAAKASEKFKGLLETIFKYI